MGQGCGSTTSHTLPRTKQHSLQGDTVSNTRAYSPVVEALCDETWGPKSDRGSLTCASHGEMDSIANVLSRFGPENEAGQKTHQSTNRSPDMDLKARPTERTPLIIKPDLGLCDEPRPSIPGARRFGEASADSTHLRTRDRPFEPQEMSPNLCTRNRQSQLSLDCRHGDRAGDSRSIEYKRPGSFLSVYSDGHWCGLKDVLECCFASSRDSTSSQDLDS